MAGNIFGTSHQCAISIEGIEARDAAKHPQMHRTAPHSTDRFSPNANSAKLVAVVYFLEACMHMSVRMIHSSDF